MKALILAATVIPVVLMAQTPERSFWSWFQKNDSALYAVRTAQEPICAELADQLHRIQEDLTFEFGPIEGSAREFIVSADGIHDAFPAVKRLVAAAPDMHRWTITAFRPGRAGPHVLDIDGTKLSSSDILVQVEADGQKSGLTLAIPGLTPSSKQSLEQAGYLLLDAVLGEFVVETRIGFIEFVAADKRRKGTWVPLDSLPRRLVQ